MSISVSNANSTQSVLTCFAQINQFHCFIDQVRQFYLEWLKINSRTNVDIEFVRSILWIQNIYWDYKDIHVPQHNYWPDMTLSCFVWMIVYPLQNHQLLVRDLDLWMARFHSYLLRLTRCGGLILSKDRQSILLVLNWSGCSWSLPMGKQVPEEESEIECAKKEIWEETGLDLEVDMDKYIDVDDSNRQHRLRLYLIVCDEANSPYNNSACDEDTCVLETLDQKFKPQTRKEIQQVKWFTWTDLRMEKEKLNSKFNRVFSILEMPLIQSQVPECSFIFV